MTLDALKRSLRRGSALARAAIPVGEVSDLPPAWVVLRTVSTGGPEFPCAVIAPDASLIPCLFASAEDAAQVSAEMRALSEEFRSHSMKVLMDGDGRLLDTVTGNLVWAPQNDHQRSGMRSEHARIAAAQPAIAVEAFSDACEEGVEESMWSQPPRQR